MDIRYDHVEFCREKQGRNKGFGNMALGKKWGVLYKKVGEMVTGYQKQLSYEIL